MQERHHNADMDYKLKANNQRNLVACREKTFLIIIVIIVVQHKI